MVLEPELGTFKGFQAKFSINQNARPKFCKARPVPYVLHEKVETKLHVW